MADAGRDLIPVGQISLKPRRRNQPQEKKKKNKHWGPDVVLTPNARYKDTRKRFKVIFVECLNVKK